MQMYADIASFDERITTTLFIFYAALIIGVLLFWFLGYLFQAMGTYTLAKKQKHPSPTVGDSTAQECTYIDGILIVNKTYPLPKSYAPHEDKTAVSALYGMFKAAKKEGLSLFVKSGYRSYLDQSIIYRGYVERDGQAAADRYSARPGHSEHQSGLAFDLNSTSSSFADTPEGIWLKDNCHKYGFIIRYPEGKEHLTGYMYEPWHVRYLGVEKATAVYESGLCLEEYLGITSAYES